MPRNGSGQYTRPVGNPVNPGETVTASWANAHMDDIATEITGSLPRNGSAPMGNPLKIVAGVVAAPGLSFNAESSTGLWQPATGSIALSVSGTEKLRVMSSGALLVGTTTDDGTSKLQVSGTAKVSSSVVVGAASVGTTTLKVGDASGSGYIEFHSAAGNRQGYIGYSLTNTTPGTLPYVAALHDFTGDLNVSGNVGIKTSSPTQKLQVGSSSDTGSQYARIVADKSNIYLGQSSGSLFGLTAGTFGTIFQDATAPYNLAVGTLGAGALVLGTNNLERMRIDSSGNATLTGHLNVPAAGRIGTLASSDTATIAGVTTANYGITCAASYTGFGGSGLGISGYNGILFATGATERMRIHANGNVLIGTSTDAGVKLNVNGGLKAIGISSWNGAGNGFINLNAGGATNTGYVEFTAANGNRQGYIGYSQTTVAGDAGTIPYVAGVHDFRGAVSCNTGFDATINNVSSSPYMSFKNIGPGSSHTNTYYTGIVDSKSYRDIYPSGATIAAIGFLRSPSSGGLASYGTIQFRASGNGEANFISCPVVGTLNADGNFTVTGNVTANSDIRLKTDIKPITNALDKVGALNGITFKNIKTEQVQTGLIAQDVQAVLPEAVIEDSDGMLSVAYGNLVGLLVEAVKELKAKVKLLEAR